MKTDDDIVRTLRAIKNKFWVNPARVEECTKRGLARSAAGAPELTEQGLQMLQSSDNPEQ
jgi:hypothetical protein